MLGEWWTAFLIGVAVLAFLAGLSDPHREPTARERRRIDAGARARGDHPEPSPPRERPDAAAPAGSAGRRRPRSGLAPGPQAGLTRGGPVAARSPVTRRAMTYRVRASLAGRRT
jgi:hypothetical protein